MSHGGEAGESGGAHSDGAVQEAGTCERSGRAPLRCGQDGTVPRRHDLRGLSRRGALGLLVALAVALGGLIGVDGLGEAGCGTFYQDSSCREDCGSCGVYPVDSPRCQPVPLVLSVGSLHLVLHLGKT